MSQHDTCNASLGLVALTPTSNNIVLSYPAPMIGDVCVFTTDAQGVESKQTIHTTTSALAQLALDPTGTRLAITSGKGTLIRILNLQETGKAAVTTHRRGTHQATIQCMAFSADSALLACTSSRQTVHIFHMESNTPGSYFGSLMGAGEPRAVASHSIPEEHSICAFVPDNDDKFGSDRKILVILGSCGAYYNLEVSKDGDNWKIVDLNVGEKKTYLPC
jgi:WD40 repeat protein